jgi:hypothetical protein
MEHGLQFLQIRSDMNAIFQKVQIGALFRTLQYVAYERRKDWKPWPAKPYNWEGKGISLL